MNIASLFKKKNNQPTDETKSLETPSEANSIHNVNEPATSNNAVQINDTALSSAKPANWIEISNDGEFICSECGNKSAPETNTENGTITADLQSVKKDLEQYPTKIIYGICPVCGMEFTFKHSQGKLFLEPSEMMK